MPAARRTRRLPVSTPRACVAAGLALWLAASGVAAQPAANPSTPSDASAEATAEAADRPAARPEAASTPSQGRLIPPENYDARPAPKDKAADQPVQGRLIPPEEAAKAASELSDAEADEGDATVPSPPTGPPAPETLRERDFDLAACKLELFTLGATIEDVPAITDPTNRDCGIARPVRVTEILPGVVVEGGADMRCDTARAMAHWMRDFVQPAATRLPGAPRVTSITPGTTYFCRPVVGGSGPAKLSEHAVGNAIDVAALTLDNGETFKIEPRTDGGDLLESFQTTIQGAACMDFTTVLGPGSNAAHSDHLHLDVKARNGGYRLCQ